MYLQNGGILLAGHDSPRSLKRPCMQYIVTPDNVDAGVNGCPRLETRWHACRRIHSDVYHSGMNIQDHHNTEQHVGTLREQRGFLLQIFTNTAAPAHPF